MFRSSFWLLAFVVGVSALGSRAFAQSNVPGTQPRTSSSSTSANNEIRNIYREGVGDGYSGSSLNQIALQNARDHVGNHGSTNTLTPSSLGASRTPSLGAGRSAKPFAQVGSSPTVSPYLNLFREDFDGGGDFNYQTLVRPQFQQLATNQQFQRQNNELSQRVQSISAQSAYQNPAGSESIYPTGHQTAFGYYSSFYPGMPQARGK